MTSLQSKPRPPCRVPDQSRRCEAGTLSGGGRRTGKEGGEGRKGSLWEKILIEYTDAPGSFDFSLYPLGIPSPQPLQPPLPAAPPPTRHDGNGPHPVQRPCKPRTPGSPSRATAGKQHDLATGGGGHWGFFRTCGCQSKDGSAMCLCVRALATWWSAPSAYKFVHSGKPSGGRLTKLLSVVTFVRG